MGGGATSVGGGLGGAGSGPTAVAAVAAAQKQKNTDRMLARIGEEAGSLKELEPHYYSSAPRTAQNVQP